MKWNFLLLDFTLVLCQKWHLLIDCGLEYIHTFSGFQSGYSNEDFSIHLNLISYSKNGDSMFIWSGGTDELSCMV